MWRRLIGQAASAVDRAASLAAFAQSSRVRGRSRAEKLGHADRIDALLQIAEWYPASAQDEFYPAPRAIDPEERIVSESRGGRLVDLSWPSDVPPFRSAMADKWSRLQHSHVAHARLHLHCEGPRNTIILVHGYLGGTYWLEERSWPTHWLRRIGLDLAFIVLPMHGLRRAPGRAGAPAFPSADPRVTIEMFRQVMSEVGDLVRYLNERGHERVGIMGMSLGGYTTALAATVVRELDFAVPVIPLVSIADFARDQGRLGANAEEMVAQHAALERAHVLVSPLARPNLLPGRVRIVAGEADRITPIAHARRLAEHFEAPLDTWPGGHLLQLGRADAFRGVGRALRSWGVTG